MDIYNRAKAKFERKSPSIDKKYGREVRSITENIDLHNSFIIDIDHLREQRISDRSNGIYQNLLIQLRRAWGKDQITRTEFDNYKKQADDIIDKEIALQQKKAQKQKQKEEKANQKEKALTSDVDLMKESKTPEVDFTKKRVRGEESLGDNLESKRAELEKKIGKWESFRELIGSPVSRILLFVVLAVFLMFYITKSNMANIISSPVILILAILFILLVLGKGGKTRTHTYSEDPCAR